MTLPARAGIYAIVHIDSGRRYVGSAMDVRRRWWTHQNRLRRGRHDCHHLQRAWRKYGEAAFRIEVIELCLEEPTVLAAREQHWLDRFAGRLFNHRRLAEQFAAAWYRTPEGQAYSQMHAKRIAAIRRQRPVAQAACERCGVTFPFRDWGKPPRFCSNRCACAERQAMSRETRSCVICGAPFDVVKYRGTKTCSPVCRGKFAPTGAKIAPQDAERIRDLLAEGRTGRSVAKEFGISTAQVSRIKNGTRWTG